MDKASRVLARGLSHGVPASYRALAEGRFSHSMQAPVAAAGKTQLVLDYVRQYRTEYKATFWIEAGQKESLKRDYINLYQTLFVGVHNVTSQKPSMESAILAVKGWLSERQGPWLFVLDGADLIDDEAAEGYVPIRQFILNAPSLYVIITTRSGIARHMRQLEAVHVGDMEANEAVELFYKYSKLPHYDHSVEDEVRAIVEELGYLALAITLAGTYAGTNRRLQSNIKAYLPEYRQRRRELLFWRPNNLIHQYNETISAT
ncbi:hypothetical protein NX059_012341 [Plenodomus lindquistii]|nr:hypothetical protein NX059_012341 [Plenodomus lindquistii]